MEIEGYARRHKIHMVAPHDTVRDREDHSWIYTACGDLLLDAHVTDAPAYVGCRNCQRTRAFKDAKS